MIPHPPPELTEKLLRLQISTLERQMSVKKPLTHNFLQTPNSGLKDYKSVLKSLISVYGL